MTVSGADRQRPPFDRRDEPHACQDETAAVVNDRWVCNCPGGPFYMRSRRARVAALPTEPMRAGRER